MLFNSIEFAFFFILVTVIYYLLPHAWRWLLLLAASCYFYMAFVPVYILILAFTIVIDYIAGICLEKIHGKRKKIFLAASIIANIGVLAIFKYYNFINLNLSWLLGHFDHKNPLPYLSILLPIGLSFHTFQAMSYTIEVYRGNQKAERHFGIYALYVMFYPQLVAGPIERPQNMIHQFYERHSFDYKRITDGLKLMAWGLFKKVVIADRISVLVDGIYNNVHQYRGLPLILTMMLFSFQIFCDFSGYSDMAIGAAQVMGFKLMNNFNRPYSARSIQDFWTRWHISLSTWFRDYLYIPLGGNRVSVPRMYFNLLVVFLLSGLWHGPSWTFVVWGALHWFYMTFGIATKRVRHTLSHALGLTRSPRVYNFIQIVTVFILVSIAWVFFRAATFSDALYILSHCFAGILPQISDILHRKPHVLELPVSIAQVAIIFAAILLMEVIHKMQDRGSIRAWIADKPTAVRWTIYYAAVLAIIFVGMHESRQFIYFQF
ncbi:MAG: MBOAT family protein [Taibaiella sp.]|nr:MBOAT family protein [Taibaiella sp.]